jgi:hypothetical protein
LFHIVYTILPPYITFLQKADCEGKTDEEIDEMIDGNEMIDGMGTYWLEDCKCILTIKVHRANSEFTFKVSDAPAGITRDKQHMNETQRLEKAQSEAAEEREEAVASCVELRSRTLEAAESLAAERILCSKVKHKSAKVS